MKGKIVSRPLTALNNKLCIERHWFEKDHTDSEHFCEYIEIMKDQWNAIIEKELIGKEIEFKKLPDDPSYTGNAFLAKIIFPEVTYTEQEVQRLVIMAWRDGFYSVTEGRQVAVNTAKQFWEQNKKK